MNNLKKIFIGIVFSMGLFANSYSMLDLEGALKHSVTFSDDYLRSFFPGEPKAIEWDRDFGGRYVFRFCNAVGRIGAFYVTTEWKDFGCFYCRITDNDAILIFDGEMLMTVEVCFCKVSEYQFHWHLELKDVEFNCEKVKKELFEKGLLPAEKIADGKDL